MSAHLEPAVVVGHTVSLATIAAALSGALPAVATLFAILFYVVQLWESKTVQGWVHGHKAVQKTETAAAVLDVGKAQAKLVEATAAAVAVEIKHAEPPATDR